MDIKKIFFYDVLNNLQNLKNRLLFLCFCIIVLRTGVFIPIPGINLYLLNDILKNTNNSFIDIFNMFSGGSLLHASIFALGIMPYISSSIIIQLFTVIFPSFMEFKNEGSEGKYKINQYTRYLTLCISIVQACALSTTIMYLPIIKKIIIYRGILFYLTSVITLVTGTMFLMWLGEQISEKGIGNGVSVIIFTGIISNLPKSLFNLLDQLKNNYITYYKFFLILFLVICTIYFIVFIEIAQRKILIQYASRRYQGNRFFSSDTYLPLKLNMAGVIPSIFSSSIIMFPYIIMFWLKNSNYFNWISNLLGYLYPKSFFYLLVYLFLIIFFSFFYTLLMYNSNDIANNLKKSGAYITGIRPGLRTSNYINNIILRLTLLGSLYMSIICLIPDFMYDIIGVSFYFGGTSLLIVIVVVIEFITQIQTLIMSNKYLSMLKKINF